MVVVSCPIYMSNKNKRILDLPQLEEVFICCCSIAIKKLQSHRCTLYNTYIYKAEVIL
jgi:hypothetical protein